jgi:hypothetical protein
MAADEHAGRQADGGRNPEICGTARFSRVGPCRRGFGNWLIGGPSEHRAPRRTPIGLRAVQDERIRGMDPGCPDRLTADLDRTDRESWNGLHHQRVRTMSLNEE